MLRKHDALSIMRKLSFDLFMSMSFDCTSLLRCTLSNRLKNRLFPLQKTG